MRVDAYLDRIRYDGPTAPTPETLRSIHRAHMWAVPFENLDIHLGTPIVLSVPAFYEKIVARRRGGFCYELNGLFAWLLAALGWKVTILSARVASSGRLSPEFDHLLLLVDGAGQWIADVGFGDSFLEPMSLEPGLDEEHDEDGYAIVEDGGTWTMQKLRGGTWEPQYVFALTPRRLEDFQERSLFQQTSPESHFTRAPVCSLARAAGRVTLSGRRLNFTSGERREERELTSAAEYRGILMNELGIKIREQDAVRLWAGGPRP
jgi:N-hydroxyarylamine O-acetyltransferase